MLKTIGAKVWAIPGGHMPLVSSGAEPANTSRDELCVLNAGHSDAHLQLTIYYEEHEPVGPYPLKVAAQRVRHVRFNDLIDPQALPAKYQPYVQGIRQETDALGRVVTNFLNFARPESIALAEVDLEAVARRAVEELRVELLKPVALEVVGTFGLVAGDEILLRQTFSNLIRNAAEACESTERPSVTIEGSVDPEERTASVVVHDFVLFPLYALADRVLPAPRTRGVPVVNYIRIPAMASALCLVVFLPGIVKQGAQWYVMATGQTQDPFLGRWLLLTAGMFAVSALVYVVRIVLARVRGRADGPISL